jgi:hypothetical protein
MKTTGLQTTRLVVRPLWFPAKWKALVNRSVHAPMKTPLSGNSAFGGGIKLRPSGASAGLGGGIKIPASGANSGLGGGIKLPPSGASAGLGGGIKILASGANSGLGGGIKIPASTTIPNLWVENGVIWQLPNLLVGFTSYSAATAFFSSVKSLGYESASSSWYEGTPFSATDFPILRYGTKGVEIVGTILIWPSLNALPFASKFLPMLPVSQPLIPSSAPSAGPVAPTSVMASFSANSPTGVQNFQARYIMYAPWGPNPLSGYSTSASGVQYDMILYSWWYNF